MIEVKSVTKKFGSFTAVDNISFTVENSSIYGLIGYNGSSMENIPIYSSMKKTVEFLQRHDISFDNLTADNVAEMKLITPEVAGVSIVIRQEKSMAASFLPAEFVEEIYGDRENYENDSVNAFSDEEGVTDRKLIEKYFSAYRSYCSYSGDNGKFVQFIFKDGSDLVAYIPEKEL